ncbi:MAG: hypothetical protein ACFFCQ_17405 [Promethearchaeota archaeon]
MSSFTDKVRIHRIGSSCLGSVNFKHHMKTILALYADYTNIIVISALPAITDKLIGITRVDTLVKRKELIEDIEASYISMATKVLSKEFIGGYQAFLNRNLPYFYKSLRKYPLPYAELVFQGEFLSAELIRQFIKSCGKNAITLDAENLILVEEENGSITPDLKICNYKIKQILFPLLKNNGTICLVPGFYGIDRTQKIVLLGRNGSDTTAAILGHGLADDFEVEILFWKDVDGLFTGDPKVDANVERVPKISHKEFLQRFKEYSAVIHPQTVEIAARRNIILKIRNFENPFSSQETIIQS